ncbi:MAG TPA: sigma factor-like helix-turn-helix DNA-binding protein [Candidatus Limnocylindrales bacterium]|nr:sigma factor-like helix-turn-helix DNA-binding protein [Candidatus Limnocylindrales bacterium]
MLDRTRRHQRRLRLLDLYGSLLTDHQRRILHLAWEEDWSYGEIAEREQVSRTAIYDLVRRTGLTLETYERKLRLDRERALRARSLDHLRRRLSTLERQVGALHRLIEKTA